MTLQLPQTSLSEAQVAYEKSTDLEATTKGLRKLANINLQIIDTLEKAHSHSPMDTIIALAIAVIDCYAQIIQQAIHFPLQDVLGLLTTIFKYGQRKEAVAAATRALENLPIDCWLEAIPQLTAQLNHPSPDLQLLIERHMKRLARAHPHTMLSNLAAVAQYPSRERAEVANRLLDLMRLYDDILVEEVSWLYVTRFFCNLSLLPFLAGPLSQSRAPQMFDDERRDLYQWH